MPLAPMPDHRRANDPHWLRLFNSYSHIIEPLRRRALPTDFETCGGAHNIHVDLPDGSYLTVASEDALTPNPHDIAGWHVCRHHDDIPTIQDLIYDSTMAGHDLLNRQLRSPLFAAIDAYLAARGLTDSWRAAAPSPALRFQHVNAEGAPLRPQIHLFIDRQAAVTEYAKHHQGLYEDGWRRLSAHPSRNWPGSTWARGDAMLHLTVTSSEFVTGTDITRG